MPVKNVLLTLSEPLTCSRNPVVSNEIHTVDYIPATILRGALYSAMTRTNRSAEVNDWLGVGNRAARYSPAMPLSGELSTVPMPLSFVNDKGDAGFGGSHGVLNLLWFEGKPAPEQEGDHRFQWTRPAKRWLVLNKASNPVAGYSHDTESHMHVGLHYERQSSRKGALFSRSEIQAGTKFRFLLDDPEDRLADLPSTVFLGKRRSAGSGAAMLQFEPQNLVFAKGPAAKTEYLIHFLSDCLVASELGGWEVGLSEKGWGRVLGNGIKVAGVTGRSAHRQVFGWSNTWGRPREPVTAIAAGSVFRIVTEGDASVRFKELEENGFGARTEEGFGWIAVNSQWLFAGNDGMAFGKGKSAENPQRCQDPVTWPGLEKVERESARDLVRMARAIHGAESRKLADLASLAARSSDVRMVIEHLRMMAGRPHPRGWEKVLNLLDQKKVTELREVAGLRFVLSSAATLSRKGDAQ